MGRSRTIAMSATIAAVVAFSVAPVDAKENRKALKSCLAALDAAESVGTGSELYEENARRCRTGINTPEKVVKKAGPYTPTTADFALNVVTLEQSCFGSAGCNVTYRIEVSYVGAQIPGEDESYRVVYELRGGEDQKIGSFELQGDQYSIPSDDFISTPPNPVLTAVVTSVVED